jgi:transposase
MSAKQLAKFMGTGPTEKRSGSSVKGKGHINRSDSKSLLKILYCASWFAIRFNNACKKLYQRLKANGRPTKLALITVANLLLGQIFTTV